MRGQNNSKGKSNMISRGGRSQRGMRRSTRPVGPHTCPPGQVMVGGKCIGSEVGSMDDCLKCGQAHKGGGTVQDCVKCVDWVQGITQ